MSRKFYIVQDRDEDGFFASVKRHITAFVVMALVLFLAFAIVIGSTLVGMVKGDFEQQQRVEASATRLAEQQRVTEQRRVEAAQAKATASAQLAKAAAAAELAKANGPAYKATLRGDTELRAGPGSTYGVVSVVKEGLEVGVVARSSLDPWYLLDDGSWIDGAYLSSTFPPLPVINRYRA